MAQLMVMGLVVAVAVAVCLYAAVAAFKQPVSRPRLEKFAARQRLRVTADNGPLVLHALGITQRWRTLGLWTGIACGVLWSLREGRLTLDFAAAFIGWFAGAVVAEWRIAGIPRGEGRRAASLAPRTLSSYLRRGPLVTLAVALAIWLGATIAAALRTGGLAPWAWAAVTLSGLALLVLTLRRVVDRPQPPAGDDLVAADDALRARAAAVLTGSAIAALGLPTAAVFEVAGRSEAVYGNASWAAIGLLLMLLELGVGWRLATDASPARTGRARPAPAATQS
ncbi:hypothetical protein [Knoellia koreensis]|uniref:Uncharacterized protein n=1 Tax=Knoellia koreensis TaxID=2730921 RepID=A0A849H9R0_9MICO|nr:hypothetical protein [Knoellia sp. DB2414S]NNM46610.1 hypothetical protein [Knoellia sp. DB2414S]